MKANRFWVRMILAVASLMLLVQLSANAIKVAKRA